MSESPQEQALTEAHRICADIVQVTNPTLWLFLMQVRQDLIGNTHDAVTTHAGRLMELSEQLPAGTLAVLQQDANAGIESVADRLAASQDWAAVLAAAPHAEAREVIIGIIALRSVAQAIIEGNATQA